jgi:hypothetical protein
VIFITPQLLSDGTSNVNQRELDRAERMQERFGEALKSGLLE